VIAVSRNIFTWCPQLSGRPPRRFTCTMHWQRSLFSALALVTAAAQLPPSANRVQATSDRVKWVGRTIAQPDGSRLFDDVGVSATVVVDAKLTYLAVDIRDNCAGGYAGGGSRWLVTITTADGFTAAPNHRISTFWSSPYIPTYMLFTNQGGRCDPGCTYAGNTTIMLTRITESRVSVCDASGNLSVSAFASDGAFLAPPPPAGRFVEFIGDSITAGNLNDGATDGNELSRCGNIAMNDDITYSSGSLACLAEPMGLGCDTTWKAWGGITLPSMSWLYKYSWGWGVGELWSWAAQERRPDAVVINLGTNDRPSPPALNWQDIYVEFVQNISENYGGAANAPTFFLAYGPMTSEYEPFVTNVTKTLVGLGVKANTIDLTLEHPMTGCFGHPSFADNREIANKTKLQIASVMGWN